MGQTVMLRAVVVGNGNIGPVHLKALQSCEKAEVYGVCDINRVRADEGARKYQCRSFYHYADVLADPAVDVVHICTPHYLHKAMVVDALEHQKHVVLEKPIALDRNQLQEVFEAEKKSHGRVCVMFQNRTNHAICVLQNILESRKYGKLLTLSGFLTWDRDAAYYLQDQWRGKWKTEGGGVVINQSIHLLDLLCRLGGTPQSISATISAKRLGEVIEVEDTADALIWFENGIRATFYASNAYGITTPMQVVCEAEQARLRYSDNYLYLITENQPPQVIAGNHANTIGKTCWGDGHVTVIADFYRSLVENTPFYLDLSSAEDTGKVMCALYESARQNGKKVAICKS